MVDILNVVQNRSRVDLLVAHLLKDTGIINEVCIDSVEFRIAIQKSVYLLQVVGGLDLGFRFEWLSMGPYSKGLQNYYQRISKILINGVDSIAKLSVSEQNALEAVKKLLFTVKDRTARLDVKTLEVVASLIMLCRDVYPRPSDPVEELVLRKKVPKEDALKIWGIVGSLGICI